MFVAACETIRETIYGLNGLSQIGANQVTATNATGFMVAPGIIATAAHFCHIENDPTKPVHQVFEAIRSPDIGQNMEAASFIAEDTARDVALLAIKAPRSKVTVTLDSSQIPTGTASGSLGFPLASIIFSQQGRSFNLVERFQSASISAFGTMTNPAGNPLHYYETDALMYGGSSGCPGFLLNGRVFGMHVSSITDQPASAGAAKAGGTRLAISIWVPAQDIIIFAGKQGITT